MSDRHNFSLPSWDKWLSFTSNYRAVPPSDGVCCDVSSLPGVQSSRGRPCPGGRPWREPRPGCPAGGVSGLRPWRPPRLSGLPGAPRPRCGPLWEVQLADVQVWHHVEAEQTLSIAVNPVGPRQTMQRSVRYSRAARSPPRRVATYNCSIASYL